MQYHFEFWFPLCSCVESIYCDWKFSGSLSLAKQLMLAVGDSGGTLHILEAPWTLSHPSANEVSPYPSFHYSLPPAWPMTLCMQYLVSPKDNSITESIGSNVLQSWTVTHPMMIFTDLLGISKNALGHLEQPESRIPFRKLLGGGE